MNASTSSQAGLSPDLYRRFLMLTCAWPGTRALPGSLVLKYHSGNHREPLFWCGGPDELSIICEELAEKRSIFLMRGTYGVLPPTSEIVQALGQYYANEIIKIQPQGAYRIGGFCEAGCIAYEIAQVLIAQGYQVKLLVLFERDLIVCGFIESLVSRAFLLIDKAGRHWKLYKQIPSGGTWKFFKYCYYVLFERLNPAHNQSRGCPDGETLPADLINPVQPIPCSLEEEPYTFKPYPGSAVLVYIRWGRFGYFRFRMFRKHWDKIVLGGTDFLTIPGWAHYMPNWRLFGNILNGLLNNDLKDSGPYDVDPIQ